MKSASEAPLVGRRVLVTGAVGILGTALTAAVARAGGDVILVDLDDAATAEAAARIAKAFDVQAVGLSCDLGDSTQTAKLVERAEVTIGGVVDVVVNNAATKGSSLEEFLAPLHSHSARNWREVMSVNLEGAFDVARTFGLRMIEAGAKGSIVQISSIYGAMGPDFRVYEGSEYKGLPITSPAVYSASKAALIGLTRYLATAWGPHGIRVNAICPGGVRSGQNETFRSRYGDRVPLGRMAEPDEIADPVVFLASGAARYVTGQVLMIDGGLSAW
jgi:NAD(P)-dependent dehydrogenase (short-subunit alcohol dehydrogenase family)